MRHVFFVVAAALYLVGCDGEKDLIIQALDKANNNKTQAAKLLNMSYDALRSHLKKYGIQ